jgi:hypothetical protein
MTDAPKKRSLFRPRLSTCVDLIFLALLLFAAHSCLRSTQERYYYKNVAQRCLVQMQKQADMVAIRNWLLNIKNESADVPECLSKLTFDELPGNVYTENGRVHVVWGSGFGHWGLVVGPADMPIPASVPMTTFCHWSPVRIFGMRFSSEPP